MDRRVPRVDERSRAADAQARAVLNRVVATATDTLQPDEKGQ
jgi:hypothetical protein